MDANKALMDTFIKIGQLMNHVDGHRKNPELSSQKAHWNGMHHGLRVAQEEVAKMISQVKIEEQNKLKEKRKNNEVKK